LSSNRFLDYQCGCSILLAASLKDLFPTVKQIDFQGTKKYFFADFILPFSINKEVLLLLEERMREWVKRDVPIHFLEMTSSNAVEFLLHHRDFFNAEKQMGTNALIPLIQVDHFVGKCPQNCFKGSLKSTGEIPFFKLLDLRKEDFWIRVVGMSETSKKTFKVRLEEYPLQKSHLHFLKELELFKSYEGKWVWSRRGTLLKAILLHRIVKEFARVDRIITPTLQERERISYHRSYFRDVGRDSMELFNALLYGDNRELLASSSGLSLMLFCFQEKNIFYFLQITVRLLKLFFFDFEIVSTERINPFLREALEKLVSEEQVEVVFTQNGEQSITFRVQDHLGRHWRGPCLRYEKREGVFILSFFESLEQLIALMLEKMQGKLPFWLQPEQLSIFILNLEYGNFVKKKLEEVGIRIRINDSKENLMKYSRRALRERIPFSIVIGDREQRSQQLTIKEGVTGISSTMNLETLVDRLRQLEG